MLFKNVASQKLLIFARDLATGAGKAGDAAQITGLLSKDGAGPVAIADTNPTEIGGGWYVFDITQTESNADILTWYGASTTANIVVEGGTAYTALPPPTPNEIATELLDLANGVENGVTPRQTLRIMAAVLAGKVSGAGSGEESFTGLDGSTPRVEVTVDPAGNRTNVNYTAD